MAPTTAVITNTPNTSTINRVKPYTLQGLVENLNEVKKNHNLSFFILLFLVTCRTRYFSLYAI
jgi:hypothetical protein